jgi:diguanylate cyclase (GGDEF)-like protein/PAS domain S-box-containing protein
VPVGTPPATSESPGGCSAEAHRLHALLEHATQVVATVDEELVVTYVSPSVERLTGYPPDHYVGTPITGHLHPDDDLGTALVASVAVRGALRTERRRLRRWDETYVEVQVTRHNLLHDPAIASVVLNIADLSGNDDSVAALRSSEDRYRRIVANVQEAIIVIDPDGAVMIANARAEHLFGVEPGGMLTHTLEELGIGEAAQAAFLRRGSTHGVRVEVALRDGDDSCWTSVASDPLHDAGGALVGHLVLAADITSQRGAVIELAARAHQMEAIATLGTNALGIRDLELLLAAATDTAIDELALDRSCLFELVAELDALVLRAGAGWPDRHTGVVTIPAAPSSALGGLVHDHEPVVVPDVREDRTAARALHLDDLGVRSGIVVAIGGDQHPYGLLVVGSSVARAYDAQEVAFVTGLANVLAAAVDRDRAEAEARRLARHDALTGSVNRADLERRLLGALAHAGGDVRPALLLIGLDGLRLVNDALGLTVGDEVLRRVAVRLDEVVGDRGCVARLDGDVFAVLVPQVVAEGSTAALGQEIVHALEAPHRVGGRAIVVTAGLGAAEADEVMSGGPEARAASLLVHADLALTSAKRLGRGRVEVFDDRLLEDAEATLSLATALRGATDRGEMHLRYQPEVDLRTDSISVEALLRWDHPIYGSVPPDRFIPIAEEFGMIIDIGTWVLDEALRQMAAWQAEPDLGPAVIGINLSPRQVSHSGMVEEIVACSATHGVDPAAVCFEITETAMVDVAGAALDTVRRLRALGYGVAIDDFGTGFSSLARLQRLPVSALKVDQSFVAGITTRQSDRSIVAAVIGLAHGLGLQAVAEGVETAEQLEILREVGCDAGQGYLWTPALRPPELAAWMSVWSAEPGVADGAPG